MKNNSIGVLIAIVLGLVVLIIICGAAGMYVYANYFSQPLAPAITYVPSSTVPALPTLAATLTPGAGTSTPAVAPSSTPIPATPTPAQPGTCGKSGSIIVLVSGIDAGQGLYLQGADLIRLVKVDFTNKSVTAISLPKDMVVSGPSLSKLNIPSIRLGLVYDYVSKNAVGNKKDVNVLATNLLANAIYDQFEVLAQDYVTIDTPTFLTMVDTVGGVDITLLANYLNFQAGKQNMNGQQLFEYLRYGTESERQIRQNQAIQALREKLLDPNTITKLPTLISTFSLAITTDFSPQQLTELSCMVQAVPKDRIRLIEVSPYLYTLQSDGSMLPRTADVKAFLRDNLGISGK